MKKLLLILMFLPLMAIGQSDSLKNDVLYAPYPQYSFWSNWEGGVRVGIAAPFRSQVSEPASTVFGLMLYKELNNIWSVGFGGTANFLKNETDKYGSLTANVQMSLTDLFKGYDSTRKANIYVNGGFGLGVDKSGMLFNHYGKLYYEALVGLGIRCKINDLVLRIEDNIHLPGDLGNGFKYNKSYYNCLSIILTYNFGVTETDKIRLKQMDDILYKGETYDSVVTEYNTIIDKCQDSLQRTYIGLVKAVVECDSLCTRVERLEKNTEEFEKLRAHIDQMREEQYTYWALPVSIQFDFDSYNVNDSEQYKVKALADVIKTTEYNYIVVGFADSIGTNAYNEELSLKRANAVKDEFVQRGVREDRIEVRAVGMDSPFGTLHKTNRKVSVYRVIE